jgi:hypothetical protein
MPTTTATTTSTTSTTTLNPNIQQAGEYESVGIFKLSWIDRLESTDFVFQVRTLGLHSIWAAFGFSSDITMVC